MPNCPLLRADVQTQLRVGPTPTGRPLSQLPPVYVSNVSARVETGELAFSEMMRCVAAGPYVR